MGQELVTQRHKRLEWRGVRFGARHLRPRPHVVKQVLQVHCLTPWRLGEVTADLPSFWSCAFPDFPAYIVRHLKAEAVVGDRCRRHEVGVVYWEVQLCNHVGDTVFHPP